MRTILFAVWASLVGFALADVKITKPAPGATLSVGALSVEWSESGDSPALADMTDYQIFLCAGGNTDGTYIDLHPLVTTGKHSLGNVAEGVVTPSLGGSTKNAYFLKMVSTTPKGTVTNFSGRFTLTGMTGSFPPNIVTALSSLGSTTSGPPRKNDIAANVNPMDGDPNFAIPFGDQTGSIRYAPMQSLPPTKITAKDKPPLYPTSSVKIATTFLPPAAPRIVTTMTQSKSYTITMIENPASPGPGVNEDLHRFLNRWRD